jgi:hypothetical protein
LLADVVENIDAELEMIENLLKGCK